MKIDNVIVVLAIKNKFVIAFLPDINDQKRLNENR